MPKKLTIGFIRKQFENNGYTLLSKIYVNNNQNLDYICPSKHVGTTTFRGWQQGHRCLECSKRKKLTFNFVRERFEKERYILLSKEYIDSKQKLKYICPNAHKGSICWGSWQQGRRCAICSGKKKLTISYIHEQFEKEGYILLIKKYKNAFEKLDYICPKNHSGTISWSNWKKGHRCAKCRYENNKGRNNPNWNPNLTDEDRVVNRDYLDHIKWSYAVKERDNFTCQICGNTGGNLISHHLDSYNSNPDLRTALSNGVCLCKNCHKEFHSKYGYGNNTKTQFKEFKIKYK